MKSQIENARVEGMERREGMVHCRLNTQIGNQGEKIMGRGPWREKGRLKSQIENSSEEGMERLGCREEGQIEIAH